MSEHEFESREEFKEYLKNAETDVTIIKFQADWCNPCKVIAPYVKQELVRIKGMNPKKTWKLLEVNVDNSLDVYSFLKRLKMVRGIPAILCYVKQSYTEDTFFVPNHIVIGAKEKEITRMFETILL